MKNGIINVEFLFTLKFLRHKLNWRSEFWKMSSYVVNLRTKNNLMRIKIKRILPNSGQSDVSISIVSKNLVSLVLTLDSLYREKRDLFY